MKLLEFIASIKYYSRVWARANIFAKLSNFLSNSSVTSSFKAKGLPDYDIFTQHYFFYAYELVYSKTDGIMEGADATWLVKTFVSDLNHKLFFFLNAQQLDKFERKVAKEFRFFTKDTEAIESIDVDKYLMMVIDEYLE